MLQCLALLTLILLALLLPFELENAWLDLGPLLLTNVELVLWLALALALLDWWLAGWPRPPLPRRWLVAGLLFLGALFLSALLAPDFRANAFKAALRTASGMALTLAVSLTAGISQTGRTPRTVIWLATALVCGGVVAAILGLAEIIYGTDFEWLVALRVVPTVVGPFLRLTGPFDYANQAAMYFEATLPLLLTLVWKAIQARRRLLALLGAAAILLYIEAIAYTFSRASFVTVIFVLGTVALLLWWPGRRLRRLPERLPDQLPLLFAAGGLLVLLLIAVNILLNPLFRLRFQSESDNDWYLVHFQVPAELVLTAGEEELVPVTVTNDGAFTWRTAGSTPVNLAARWVQPASGRELSRRPRWPLTQAVAPGESLKMEIPVRAPREGGRYRLVWDMVQEYVIWFSAKTGQETATTVIVMGTAPAEQAAGNDSSSETFEEAWVYAAPIPGRLLLWRAAWQLWRARPLLGVGLDNYRLLYGRPLEYESWNTNIHSNNWYIETVVSVGLLGSLPFFFLLAFFLWDGLRTFGRPGVSVWQASVAAGLLAYMVHGLLDYFLLFNATGLLFWLLLGLWLALRPVTDRATS